MKKTVVVVFVLFVVCLMILVALLLGANGRRRTMESREPLTLGTLDKIAATWERNPPERTPTDTRTEPGKFSVAAQMPVSDEVSPAKTGEQASLTPHLKRTLTKEELAEWRTKEELVRQEKGDPPTRRWQWKVAFAYSEQRAMLSTAGSEEAAYWYGEAALAADVLQDWKTATNYFREVLESSPDHLIRELCCSRLAWLEEDPAVAERLLDLSCESDDPCSMLEAIRLAEATGSDALREHYLARLKALDTESATWVLKMLEKTKLPDTP